MRSFFVSLATWLLVGIGAFLLTRGALDYWESRHGQNQIAADWEEQNRAVAKPNAQVSADQNVISPDAAREVQRRARSSEAPNPAKSRQGDAVAKLSIPRLSTVLYVVEGTDDRDLKRGPGHLEGSVLPGQDGNCVIAGHRDTHFRILKDIKRGDEIVIDRNGSEYRYKVEELSVITPDNIACLRPTKDAELHLITCFPFHYVGSAPRRFVVRAKLEA